MDTEASEVRVHTGESGKAPAWNKATYSLWSGGLPVIPANAWLGHVHGLGLAKRTRRAYAYGLLNFFRWLAGELIPFWGLELRHIDRFRSYLNNSPLKETTRAQYLCAVSLMLGWLVSAELRVQLFPKRGKPRRHKAPSGLLARLRQSLLKPQVNNVFQYPILNRSSIHRKHGLPPLLQQKIWDVLEYRYPVKAKSHLRYRPSSKSFQLREARAERAHLVRRMLWYRDRAIWALLLMSGPRKGEMLVVMEQDLDVEPEVLFLMDREATRHLGSLKLGERPLWFPRQHPYMRLIDEWRLFGRPIAVRLMEEAGLMDHGLLFCSRDLGPLTEHCVHHLIHRLAALLGIDRRVRPFSAHVARHTGASTLRKAGASAELIQAWLGHNSIESQGPYTALTSEEMRTVFEALNPGIVIMPHEIP